MKIKVEGMTCNHCKMAVERAAKSVGSVLEAVVSLKEKEVAVTMKPGETAEVEQIKAAIQEAGYYPV